jgi:hypothetical protein
MITPKRTILARCFATLVDALNTEWRTKMTKAMTQNRVRMRVQEVVCLKEGIHASRSDGDSLKKVNNLSSYENDRGQRRDVNQIFQPGSASYESFLLGED